MQAFGAELHLVGRDNTEAKSEASTGGHFVDDGESLDLMEGAGTLGLEIARSLADVHTVMVPVGRWPLVTGSGIALKAIQPSARVVGVQAEGAAALADSYHSGEQVEREVDTIADGLASRFPADRAFAGIRSVADEVLIVSDDQLLSALHHPGRVWSCAGGAGRRCITGRRLVHTRSPRGPACGAHPFRRQRHDGGAQVRIGWATLGSTGRSRVTI